MTTTAARPTVRVGDIAIMPVFGSLQPYRVERVEVDGTGVVLAYWLSTDGSGPGGRVEANRVTTVIPNILNRETT